MGPDGKAMVNKIMSAVPQALGSRQPESMANPSLAAQPGCPVHRGMGGTRAIEDLPQSRCLQHVQELVPGAHIDRLSDQLALAVVHKGLGNSQNLI